MNESDVIPYSEKFLLGANFWFSQIDWQPQKYKSQKIYQSRNFDDVIGCTRMHAYWCDLWVMSIHGRLSVSKVTVCTRWLFIVFTACGFPSIPYCSNLALRFVNINFNCDCDRARFTCVKEEAWQSFVEVWLERLTFHIDKNFFWRVCRYFHEILHKQNFPAIWWLPAQGTVDIYSEFTVEFCLFTFIESCYKVNESVLQ